MPKPISRAEPPPVAIRVAVVTMDSHLADAALSAASILRADCPGLALTVHAADEWGHDPARLAACHDAIARADIVIATMLFLDEHIRAVLPALAARRDGCDAMLCALSAGEVVRLTRLGRFSMSGEAGGALALLKRLRGSRGKNGQPASGRDQMRMLKRLPKILRFIPGAAQDARAYFLSLQYWLAGSEANLVQLMRLLIDRYAAGPRAALRGTLPASAPRDYPELGLYHPSIPGRLTTVLADLPGRADAAGTVGLLLMRSYLLGANTAHYDGVIAAFEARGLRVVPAFASGLDQRPAIEAFFTADGAATVDAVVSLTGFSLVGGPAYNDARAAEDMLARLDVPYVAAHPVEFQTLEQWRGDPRGLLPVEAAMMVSIPELDGAIWPMTYGGRSSSSAPDQQRRMQVEPERAARLAARVAALVALRRSAREARRVAIVLYGFPPNAGAVGTAAHLSVFASLRNTLAALAAAGYRVEVPESVDALRDAILGGNAALNGTDANVHTRIAAADHVRRETHLGEIEAVWGPAPGRHNTDGANLLVLGARFGNVFVGVQPALGTEGDPMRLLFERGFAPTHAFSAFYRWIREDFAADAVLHFGTHGGLEFMPGKHAGCSAACWPDRLIGDVPHVYLYAANNPSEGLLARRRAGATLVSYMTPPLGTAGLYRGLLDLKASIERWRALPPEADAAEREALATLIGTQAAIVDLDGRSSDIEALRCHLVELEQTLIPNGLHVVGSPPDADARAAMLDAGGITEPDRRAALDGLLGADHEIPAILHALDGGYIRPVAGGDFLRNPDMLPTGRNLHGLDPFRIPSAFAREDGARQAERLLARHRDEGRGVPETVAMVLWGIDNLKTEGGPLAQALWLIGAEPRHDSYGRVAGAALVPLDRLARPRVDVVVTLSGIFRDLLPMQVRLLAEAAFLAASAADEPEDQNPIRRHALEYQQAHGVSLEDAALRVFGNASDAYGSNVNHLVDAGTWNDEDELAETFVRRKGHAYGLDGAARRDPALFQDMLGRVDLSYQNLDSVELGVTTIDHYFDTLGGIGRAVTRARGGEKSPIYIGDQTRGAAGTVRTLSEQVAIETRTRTLNPVYVEAMLAHGGEGVRHLECAVTNTLGWSATTGEVQPWVWRGITETFVEDQAMRDRILTLNPLASARLVNRLIEAGERNYWSPDAATRAALQRASDLIEDRVEGLVSMGEAA